MSPRRKDLASLVVHEAEPGVGSIRRTEVVADALPRLIPLLFHEQPEATRLELGAVALNELLPRARLHAALVLWLAPVLAAHRRRRCRREGQGYTVAGGRRALDMTGEERR